MNTVTHIVQIFLDTDTYNLEWTKKLIELFNHFTLPSLLNQSFQDFRILLLCGKQHKDHTSNIKWNKRVELCYRNEGNGMTTPDTDYMTMTRIDCGNMLHKDAMSCIRDNIIMSGKQECLTFNKYLYWDRVNKFIYYPIHHKQTISSFMTYIFPKAIYKNFGGFEKQPFVSTPERGAEGQQLSSNMICVMDKKEGKRIEVEKSGSFMKKREDLLNILRPFSVDEEDIEGEEGKAEKSGTSAFHEKVDIIFTTYNHSEMSIDALDAIKEHTHIPYRIIWVDSGSDVKNYEMIKKRVDKFDNLSHRFNVNRFYAKPVNQGMIMSSSRYVVALSNDVMVTDGWLKKLVSLMERDPKIGLLSPLTDKIGSRGPRAQDAVKRFNLPLNGNSLELINALPSKYGDYQGNISMFCAIIRKDTMFKVGLLDERFFILGNDGDYCDRVRLAGYKTGMCLNCFVFHKHGTTKDSIFVPKSPEWTAIKKDHQALLAEKRRARAMTGSLE